MNTTPAIKLNKLSYRYPDGTSALKDISLTVSFGEKVGLIGPNGAGKSTLLLHLNGILMSKGAVEIFGLKLEKKTLNRVRKDVGIVFQHADDQLFMPSVADDIAFGPLNLGLSPEETTEAVHQAIHRVDLEGYESRSPHHLSGGEKRRVAMATILAMNPRVVILDEPSSDLDPRGRRRLISIIKTLKETTLVATHDLDLICQVCQRCIVLDQGILIADGPAKEILGDEVLMMDHGLEVPWSLRSNCE